MATLVAPERRAFCSNLVERLREGSVEELLHPGDRLVGDACPDGVRLAGHASVSFRVACDRSSLSVRCTAAMPIPRPRAITAMEAPACRQCRMAAARWARRRMAGVGGLECDPVRDPVTAGSCRSRPTAGRPRLCCRGGRCRGRRRTGGRVPTDRGTTRGGSRRGLGRGSSRAPRAPGPCTRMLGRPRPRGPGWRRAVARVPVFIHLAEIREWGLCGVVAGAVGPLDVALVDLAGWVGQLAPPVLGQTDDAFRAVDDEIFGVASGRSEAPHAGGVVAGEDVVVDGLVGRDCAERPLVPAELGRPDHRAEERVALLLEPGGLPVGGGPVPRVVGIQVVETSAALLAM